MRLHPQRGAVVFVPTVDDLREHYEIRAALEALAAARTAERFQEPLGRAARDAARRDAAPAPPAARYLELNQRFHTELYEHCGRPRLVEMIAGLRDASSAYLHIYRAAADFPVARLDAEHRAHPRRLRRARRRSGRRGATREHLQNTVEHVASRLEHPA